MQLFLTVCLPRSKWWDKRESWNKFSAIIATTDCYRLNWCISGQLLIHGSPLPGNCNDDQLFLLNTTSFISVIDQRSMLQQIHNTLVILKLFIVASLNNSLRLQRSWYCDTKKRYSCMITRKTTIHMRMFAILYNIKYKREQYLMINSSLLLSITCFWVRQAHFTNVSRIERPYWINEEGLNVLPDADGPTLFLQKLIQNCIWVPTSSFFDLFHFDYEFSTASLRFLFYDR